MMVRLSLAAHFLIQPLEKRDHKLMALARNGTPRIGLHPILNTN